MSIYQKLLREYVSAGETQAALADKIGRSQAAVNRYINGLRWPDSETAKGIDAATGGKVPFKLWQDETSVRMGLTQATAA